MSALIPEFVEKDGWWRCRSRCIYGAGEGIITGTGPSRKAAYADWVSRL